jgi:hypothetical protein
MLYFSNFFSQKSFPNNDIFIKIVDILSIINTSFMNEHLEKKKKKFTNNFQHKKIQICFNIYFISKHFFNQNTKTKQKFIKLLCLFVYIQGLLFNLFFL